MGTLIRWAFAWCAFGWIAVGNLLITVKDAIDGMPNPEDRP